MITCIPRNFEMCGIPVKVILDPELYKRDKKVGQANYLNQTIILDTSTLALQSIEHTFYHEKIHYMLYILNLDELRNNEVFVDTLAYLLHQSEKTSTDYYDSTEIINGI